MAGKAKASLSTVSQMPLACHCPRAQRQRMGTNGPRSSPLLDALHVRTATRSRPHKRFKMLAADTGYDAQDLRHPLCPRGIRPQIPKRVWNNRKPRGRPIKGVVPHFQAERTFAWFHRKYRRLVVRWERLAAGFNAFLSMAMMPMWVHRLIVG